MDEEERCVLISGSRTRFSKYSMSISPYFVHVELIQIQKKTHYIVLCFFRSLRCLLGETAKKWHTKFNIRMSQLIVQIYKLLRAASRTARRCDILVLFVARCTPVKSGEFENSYSLLFILLKSCLCWYSLRSDYFPLSKFESHLGHGSTMQGKREWSLDETSGATLVSIHSLPLSFEKPSLCILIICLSCCKKNKTSFSVAQTYAPYIHKNSITAVAIKQHSFTLLSI